MLPFDRNPRFTGREAELAELEEKLFISGYTTKTAITGLGGVGKTQLVLELLYRTEEKHKDCSIIWLLATSMESLNQAYTGLAKQLAIPGWEGQKTDVKELVQEYLSKDDAGRWILVFDNADDVDMWIAKLGSEQGPRGLVDYLPRSKRGCIIFTTRNRKTGVKLAHQNIIQFTHMDEQTATQLLEKSLVHPGLVNERQDTTALLEELAYLPLAIVQTAAYIIENGIALADYLALLAEQKEEIIGLLSKDFEDDGRYREVKNPVATTWLISFEQIRRRDSLAAEYLSFMSCIDSKNIPRSLLPSGSSKKNDIKAIGALEAYSFITRRPDTAIDLHRLVHLSTRNWLRKEGELVASTERAIVRFEEVFPDYDHNNRNLWRTYLPHARYVLESSMVKRDKTELMLRYRKCLHEDGRWDEAEFVFSSVFEIKKGSLGTKHPETLTTMVWLAATYRNKGRWNEAEELGLQVMETSKKALGAEHPDTLTSMGDLALTLGSKGRWDEAIELEVQVMETRKRVLGWDHLDTLASMHNLALSHRNKGRWDEAERLQVQVVEISKKALGLEHPHALVYLNQLASTYINKGQWDEAEELEEKVMDTRKRLLGAKHPDTLISMNNLASTYRIKGRWDEAEQLVMQVIETSKRVLGMEHPDTLTSMGILAWTYRDEGPWYEAEELGMHVMETRERVLGAEHPSTLASMENLSFTWKVMGRQMEALTLMDKCAQLRKQILGVNHPDFLSSSAALSTWQLEAEG